MLPCTPPQHGAAPDKGATMSRVRRCEGRDGDTCPATFMVADFEVHCLDWASDWGGGRLSMSEIADDEEGQDVGLLRSFSKAILAVSECRLITHNSFSTFGGCVGDTNSCLDVLHGRLCTSVQGPFQSYLISHSWKNHYVDTFLDSL